MDPTHIRSARAADLPGAVALLQDAGLPLEGFREHFSQALVAETDGAVVGCVAVELYGTIGLLRSLVVSPGRRGERLGERLTSGAVGLAQEKGVEDLYLLTLTADRFFPRFGFRVEDRAAAPKALGESREFQSACPATAVLMHLRVER
jgi:amino-acid N-acetyltransferase